MNIVLLLKIRTRLLMDFAYASGQNVVLVGPPGCGKTAMVNDFIDTQGTYISFIYHSLS